MRQTALYSKGQDQLQDIATGKAGILRTLAYFDIFHYPLTTEEIIQFMDHRAGNPETTQWLQELVEEKSIFVYSDFYSLQNNPLLAHRRKQGNLRAGKLLAKANRIGRFLYKFPYVRAVGVSGSLSKNFADERADIDFFIITKANRLWIARTFMHLFKKLTFITGHQHFYCMNYYLDEHALQLEDKNIFTAIELKTLLPVSGRQAMQQLFDANTWTDEWLPSCAYRQQSSPDKQNSILKRIAEWLFNNKAGDKLDNFLLRMTTRRWARKENNGKRNNKGQVMSLITSKHSSRANPGSFQEKVLSLYERKIASFRN